MTNSNEMLIKIVKALNEPAAQAVIKPMIEEATEKGLIKNGEDLSKFKEGFIIYLLASSPEFMKIICKDVYDTINKEKENEN